MLENGLLRKSIFVCCGVKSIYPTYQINASVAESSDRITMDLRRDEGHTSDFLAILFIKDASEMDAGTFTCKVRKKMRSVA